MTKEFACADIGFDCGFKTEGRDESEIMPKIAQHARETHNMSELSPETMTKVRGAIRERN